MHGKLTSIFRYWMRYDQGNKKSVLSFGLGADVAINYLIGLPTLRQWGGFFDFGNNNFVVSSVNTKFPLFYEPTKHGLSASVEFIDTNSNRPIQGAEENYVIMLTNLKNDGSLPPLFPSLIKGNAKYDMSTCSMVYTVDMSHLESLQVPSQIMNVSSVNKESPYTIKLPPKMAT